MGTCCKRPKFQEEEQYLKVFLYAPKIFRDMDKEDRLRTCYQHCCLKYISSQIMTNQTLRERFQIEEKNYSMVSRIIKETIEAGLIKPYDSTQTKRQVKYKPF